MKKILFSLIVALNCISFAKSASPADTEVENIKTYLNQLFESSKKVNSTSEEKEKARKTIDSSIDWDSIATLCLGPEHAKKYAGKNFGDFRNLLREVISKTAYSRMDKFWEGGTRAIIEKVDLKGTQAHVSAKFVVKDDSFQLDYYLGKKGRQWLIQDIAYEELKYSSNIREQLDAFLKEKSFSELLGKLRKRREDLDKPPKTKAS